MLVQRVLILLWKYLLVKEEELFYWWKVSKLLLAALFANARRVDVSKFRVENTAIFETPTTKTNILTFLENERLFARTTYIRLLIYLKAIYGQKNEGNRFFNYCYSMVDISWLLLLIFAIFRRSCSRNTSETTRRDVAVCKTRCRETTFSCFSLTLRWTLPCVVPVRRLLMHFGGELARTTSPETH